MKHISVAQNIENKLGIITFNRPKVRNAFNPIMIKEIIDACNTFNSNDSINSVLFEGAEENFCSGADLNWMKDAVNYNEDENRSDAKLIQDLMKTIYTLDKVTIAKLQGCVFGGGLGICACVDISFATPDTTFCFSEVKLGLSPAVISPYVAGCIGIKNSLRWLLTAEIFHAQEALQMNLINEICSNKEINDHIKKLSLSLSANAPKAMIKTKRLLKHIQNIPPQDDEISKYTVDLIAKLRTEPEAQAGISAFLSKNPSPWNK